ncbi:hypothetical protein [Montanilutibacter psychrotolerans]|uniref:Uncharacterized protein n=1 Tax=Montanilutibacter psychrotolerans TaxID=1327343 RepID=A0A3M8SRY4_9GAMM|nr:hypothetical protein [Lysobacter psychrotolerans]RNF82246.1 hypothetical protein EER27_15140 [Lysobacter psychrotolerans]
MHDQTTPDGLPPPPPLPSIAQAPPVQHAQHYPAQKSVAVAVLLELLPGAFFQTFGIGQLYAGNVVSGLVFMIGYWIVAFINLMLCAIFIGFITWPLCWIAAAVVSSLIAANAAGRTSPRRV